MFFKKKKPIFMDLPPLPEGLPALDGAPAFPDMVEHVPEQIPEIGEPIARPKSLISKLEAYKNLEIPKMEEKPQLVLKGENFIKMENFSEVLGGISEIRSVLNETNSAIGRVIEIRGVEESMFNSWQNSLQEVGKRLNLIDKTLFEKVI